MHLETLKKFSADTEVVILSDPEHGDVTDFGLTVGQLLSLLPAPVDAERHERANIAARDEVLRQFGRNIPLLVGETYVRAYLSAMSAGTVAQEAAAHIVTDPKGKQRVTLATQYDPMASAFWINGEMPDGYSVIPLYSSPQAPAQEAVAVKALEWSEHNAPNDDCRYDHVTGSGVFLYSIEWKSWKSHDGFVVYRDGYFASSEDSLDAAKAAAQADYETRIRSALASPQASEPAPQVVGGPEAITEDMVFAAFEAFELTGHFTTLHATRKALEAALATSLEKK